MRRSPSCSYRPSCRGACTRQPQDQIARADQHRVPVLRARRASCTASTARRAWPVTRCRWPRSTRPSTRTVPPACGMRDAIDALLGQDVAAIVLIAPDTDSIEAAHELEAPVPLVTADGADKQGRTRCRSIRRPGADLAVDHLASLGHRASPTSPARPRGRRPRARARMARGLRAARRRARTVRSGDWTPGSGYQRVRPDRARRRATSRPCSAANDQMALGLLHAFVGRGRRRAARRQHRRLRRHPRGGALRPAADDRSAGLRGARTPASWPTVEAVLAGRTRRSRRCCPSSSCAGRRAAAFLSRVPRLRAPTAAFLRPRPPPAEVSTRLRLAQ